MLEILKFREHVNAGKEVEAVWRTMILDVEKDPQAEQLRRATESYYREHQTYINRLMQAVITGDSASLQPPLLDARSRGLHRGQESLPWLWPQWLAAE
jgi:hypothetical protein